MRELLNVCCLVGVEGFKFINWVGRLLKREAHVGEGLVFDEKEIWWGKRVGLGY